jgi:hypothetical protein
MRLFQRRETPPSDALAHLPRDERVVSWADLADGSVVLASPSGLWWPDGDQHQLIAWPHIIKAVWRDGRLTVFEADIVDDLLLVDREPVVADLAVPRDLPPVIRKRIETNVVHSQVHPVPGGSARFVARRVPGQDGLRWWARLDDGTPDGAQVRAAVAQQRDLLAAQHAVG